MSQLTSIVADCDWIFLSFFRAELIAKGRFWFRGRNWELTEILRWLEACTFEGGLTFQSQSTLFESAAQEDDDPRPIAKAVAGRTKIRPKSASRSSSVWWIRTRTAAWTWKSSRRAASTARLSCQHSRSTTASFEYFLLFLFFGVANGAKWKLDLEADSNWRWDMDSSLDLDLSPLFVIALRMDGGEGSRRIFGRGWEDQTMRNVDKFRDTLCGGMSWWMNEEHAMHRSVRIC